MRLQNLSAVFGSEPIEICRALQAAGFDAVIVGGPVRDALRGEVPNDVDIATSARPDQIRRIFSRTFVQGSGERHGTIGVIGDSGQTYEVTTYRHDLETDGRHARVQFADRLEDDLLRRDFTINAIAIRPLPDQDEGEIVDPYGGVADLELGIIRAVGDPAQRFREDFLRIVRAVRFAGRFDFVIHPRTWQAMLGQERGLATLSRERIRDEMIKIAVQTNRPGGVYDSYRKLHEVGVFRVFLPELAACDGVTQNHHHGYDVLDHMLHAADVAAQFRAGDWRFVLAALLHDVGKPLTRSVGADGVVHFYGHERVGAEIVNRLLGARGLALSNTDREWIRSLVAHHMDLLQLPLETITQKQIRRLWARLNKDAPAITPRDLADFRYVDKAASGIAEKAISLSTIQRFYDLVAEIERERAALRLSDLAINGHDVMERLGLKCGGPIVGEVLQQLLKLVVERPELNTRERLLAMVDTIARKERAHSHRKSPLKP